MYLPNFIFAPRSCQALPPEEQLWPSNYNDTDNDGDANDLSDDDDDDTADTERNGDDDTAKQKCWKC